MFPGEVIQPIIREPAGTLDGSVIMVNIVYLPALIHQYTKLIANTVGRALRFETSTF